MKVDLASKTLEDYLQTKFSTICPNHDTVSRRFRFSDYMNRRRRGKIVVESTDSLSYILLIFFDADTEQKTKEYIYSDDEWCNIRKIIGYSDILNDFLQSTDSHQTEEFEQKLERVTETIRAKSNELSLQNVKQHIKNHNYEILQNIVSENATDTVEFWKLLYSYDQDHNVINNDISIEYENDTIIFVRAVREYWNGSDKKEYPMGLIVGVNDTPHKFFTHRIERGDKLNDATYDWQLEDIRRKLGFLYDYTDLRIDNKIPKQATTRIQGDLAIKPLSIDKEKKRVLDFCIGFVKRELYKRHSSEYVNEEFPPNISYPLTYSRQISFRQSYCTDRLKDIQSNLRISEEAVRKEQQIRGIERLSANLRQEIIRDLFLEKFISAISNNSTPSSVFNTSYENLHNQASRSHLGKNMLFEASLFNIKKFTRSKLHNVYNTRVNELFNTDWGQYNESHGNHLTIIGNATETPINHNSLFGFDTNRSETVIVTSETSLGVIHDEHDNRSYILEPGVYQFRFLEGFDPRNPIRW